MPGWTPYSEANALLALDDGAPDYDAARASLSDYSISELCALRRQADRLANFMQELIGEKRDQLAGDE